jgi:DNA-binding response OmpR family regulator
VDCPLYKPGDCSCGAGQACTNIIITDIKNEYTNGLEFLENLKIQKCKVGNVAVISVKISDEEKKRISDLGCQLFQKPVKLKQLKDWLDKCESMPEFNSGLVRWQPL